MKRTTVICLMVVLLGIGCGYAGVELVESRPYPEAPEIRMDGDAIRASMLDASLRDTQDWVLAHYRLDLEATAVQGQSANVFRSSHIRRCTFPLDGFKTMQMGRNDETPASHD